jgi:hypothetical protein
MPVRTATERLIQKLGDGQLADEADAGLDVEDLVGQRRTDQPESASRTSPRFQQPDEQGPRPSL